MLNRIKEFESEHTWFLVIEAIILVLLVGFLVMQIAFPEVLYQAQYMSQLQADEDYQLINEEYNLYSIMPMNEGQAELYETYIAYTFQNLPLYMNDYKLIIIDDDMDSSNPYTKKYFEEGYSVTAQTNNVAKVIKLHKNYIADSLIHEIGHAVDYTYKFSSTKEFKELYNQAEHNDYLNSNIGEYFADGYYRFIECQMNEETEQELIQYFENILGQKYKEVIKQSVNLRDSK